MTPAKPSAGAREIRAALGESRRWFAAIGLFSAFVNLQMLTGPLFMRQVYDRVLTSRSAPARGLHDLETMQRFASGPGPFVFFDAPWTPVFLFAHLPLAAGGVGGGVARAAAGRWRL